MDGQPAACVTAESVYRVGRGERSVVHAEGVGEVGDLGLAARGADHADDVEAVAQFGVGVAGEVLPGGGAEVPLFRGGDGLLGGMGSAVARVRTSTKATMPPRLATMSISPWG